MKTILFFGRALLVCLFLLPFGNSNAQVLQRPVAGAGTGLLAYQRQEGHPLAISSNVAMLARTTRFSAGVVSERRFLLKDLGLHQLSVALPVTSGGLGGLLSYFGNAAYQEVGMAAAYGRRLGERLDVGLVVSHFRVRVARGEGASATTAGLGL